MKKNLFENINKQYKYLTSPHTRFIKRLSNVIFITF